MRQSLRGLGDKINMLEVSKNKILPKIRNLTKISGTTYYFSQVSKVSIFPLSVYQHLYNIYKFKYIF